MSRNATFDPRAVEVAHAVGAETSAEMVIVFGSRARGDYAPESDIDLLVLTSLPTDNEFYMRASGTAFSTMYNLYDPPVNVEILPMKLSDFHGQRVSPNHVAGQAYRDGVTMYGEPPSYPPVEPDNWPDIKQRFTMAGRHLRGLEFNIEGEMYQELIGFLAQQVVENILKGWISALGAQYRNEHDIKILVSIVCQNAAVDQADAGANLSWLTHYAVEYRYQGAVMGLEDPAGLLREVSDLFYAVRERVIKLTGREDVPC